MKKILILCILMLFLFSIPANAQRITIASTDTVRMTAPGNSAAIYTGTGLYNRVMWDFVVANIATTVSVALQKKTGNGEWTNVWADSLVYTANGNYALEWDGVILADSLRFKWIAESGGANATIKHNAKITGGN